ncbi:MAG: ArgE/DapE family deacylase [Candidatus Thorarchaeota archaeon]
MSNVSIDHSILLSRLRELVAIESINPSLVEGGSGERMVADYIGECLEAMGAKVTFQRFDKDRVNVIGVLRGEGDGRTLMLNGHMDTVGVSGMEMDPFDPIYKDGKVFGRGAFDMKASLSSMLAVGDAFLHANPKPKGNLILAFVADEEYASRGTEALVKDFTADAAIVTEPTNLDVIISHRGFAWAKIDVLGRAAHGSLYNEGIDAIVKAGKVLVALEKLDRSFEERTKHPTLGRASIHASLIKGGTELSTYPSTCKIELERRTLPNEDREFIDSELSELLSNIHNQDDEFEAESNVFFFRPSLQMDSNAEIVTQVIQSCKRSIGKNPDLVGAPWWTDAALLLDSGIPAVLFGPSGDGAHAAIEYVNFESVIQTSTVLADVALSFCK